MQIPKARVPRGNPFDADILAAIDEHPSQALDSRFVHDFAIPQDDSQVRMIANVDDAVIFWPHTMI